MESGLINSAEGELCGRNYSTGQPIHLRWREGRITHVDSVETAREDFWIAPPLFDLQINGYAGIDFQQDGLSLGDLLTASRGLRAAGCARFLLTLITDEWPRMMARLRQARSLRSPSAELQS